MDPPTEPFTAAILLGASTFPRHSDTYAPNVAFLRSKQDFRAYLQDPEQGMALPDEAICDLFDLPHLPAQQLINIGRFLEGLTKRIPRDTLCNLIVYYVGHGYFAGLKQEYHIALNCLEEGYDATTGLKVTELAEVLKERARSFRRFVILDCCFAAEALKEFQGAADDAVYAKAALAFAADAPARPQQVPRKGTALFCAADKDQVARSPQGQARTMFSDALLRVLRSGDPHGAAILTLADVRELAWERLQDQPHPVRPVLHCPDQVEGDIALRVGLFPNVGSRLAAEPAVLRVAAVSAGHTTPSIAAAPAASPGATADQTVPSLIDEEFLAQVAQQLTRLIGPIAPVLIRRARQQATDLDTLSGLIAAQLNAAEGRQFLSAITHLKATRLP